MMKLWLNKKNIAKRSQNIMIRALIIILMLSFCQGAYASDCRIVETAEKVEVVCEGKPEDKKPEKILSKTEALKEIQKQIDAAREQPKSEIDRIRDKIAAIDVEIASKKNKPRPADDIKVSSISAMETERSYGYVTYSVKADVDNKGERGDVFIKLVGKNWDGHQVDFVYLKGRLDSRESKTLTTTSIVSFQHAMDIRTWEVDSINKY